MYIDTRTNTLVADDYNTPAYWQRSASAAEEKARRAYRDAEIRQQARRLIAGRGYVLGIRNDLEIGEQFRYDGVACKVVEKIGHEIISPMSEEDADAFGGIAELTEAQDCYRVRVAVVEDAVAASADAALLASYPRRESPMMSEEDMVF